jgi:hypothetical protein
MKLDRSRNYSETIGPSVARYHQDGRDFDSAGDEIGMIEEHTLPPDSDVVTIKRKPGRPPKVSE